MLVHVYVFREVVHAQENSGTGEASGCEDLVDKFAEGWRDGRARSDDSSGHIGHVFGHHVGLVIEHRTHTARHDD